MPQTVTQCPCCGSCSGARTTFAHVRGWRYVRCGGCSLVFLDPRPTERELKTFYNAAYTVDRTRFEASIQSQRALLEALGRCRPADGRLLEVGCAYGHFLKAAREEGWEVAGVELSAEAASFARREFGIPVLHGTLAEVPKGDGDYGAVVAWHLLEHETEPGRFLKQVYRLLSPEGILALRVPNVDSAVARLAGKGWQWLSPPEHVYMFSSRTLRRLLSDVGMQIVHEGTRRGDARNPFFEVPRAWTKHLTNRASGLKGKPGPAGSFARPKVHENRGWYRGLERAVNLATAPMDRLLSRKLAQVGLEAELFVIARKPVSCWEASAVLKGDSRP